MFQWTWTRTLSERQQQSTCLNETQVIVAKSTFPGAERDPFLHPIPHTHPWTRLHHMYQETLADIVKLSPTTDYLFEVSGQRQCYQYQAAIYNGQNIRHFINQGGLQEGLTEMCRKSDRENGYKYVNERHCSIKYKLRCKNLKAGKTKETCAHPT